MVSVIIPTYRRYEMLKEAVQSVLQQTYQKIEIIVVDDCSGDDTSKIVDISPKVTYLCNERNSGPGHSRRRGLLQCQGKYVVFLDDDDYYTDNSFFAKAIEIMEGNPSYNFVAANSVTLHTNIGAEERPGLDRLGEITAADYLEGLPYENRKPNSTFTTVFRKSNLLATGVDQMEMVNDTAIYMRSLSSGGNVFFLEQEIGVYRIHDNNISKKMTSEFIIANLKEKAEILSLVKKNKLFEAHDVWWLKQIRVTLEYFVYDSHPSLCEYKKIQKWCIKASQNNPEVRMLCRKYFNYLIDYRICSIKRKIKRLINIFRGLQ